MKVWVRIVSVVAAVITFTIGTYGLFQWYKIYSLPIDVLNQSMIDVANMMGGLSIVYCLLSFLFLYIGLGPVKEV